MEDDHSGMSVGPDQVDWHVARRQAQEAFALGYISQVVSRDKEVTIVDLGLDGTILTLMQNPTRMRVTVEILD